MDTYTHAGYLRLWPGRVVGIVKGYVSVGLPVWDKGQVGAGVTDGGI